MAECLADTAGQGVVKAVYVQANRPPDRAEDEARFVEDVALATGWPHATVAYADLTVPDARPAPDRLMRFPRLRGVCQQFHYHDNRLFRFAARPTCATTRSCRRIVPNSAITA